MVVQKILTFCAIFVCSTSWLYYLWKQLHSTQIYFPQDLEQLKAVTAALRESQRENYYLVIVIFCSAYMYKQMFAIPGSFFTNILSGAIFGTKIGFPLVCILSASGASCCYFLAKLLGRELCERWFSSQLASVEATIHENRHSLFFFLLSARLFPASPNWLMNMSFGIVGVPIIPFYFSVLFGLMPYNFVCVHTGETLSSITSLDDLFSYSTLFTMLLIAIVAALPGMLLRRQKLHHP